MKNLFLIILTLILSVSTCHKNIDSDVIEEHTMVSYDDTLNRYQLDSLFVADTLSSDFENDWIIANAVSQDKQSILYKYVYIKELTDSTGTIYTLYSYQDSLYIINKRINN